MEKGQNIKLNKPEPFPLFLDFFHWIVPKLKQWLLSLVFVAFFLIPSELIRGKGCILKCYSFY